MRFGTRTIAPAMVLACVASVVAYHVGRAQADGIPTTNPLYFAGTLEDAAAPVADGSHSIAIALWDAATAGTMVCTTGPIATAVVSGRFRIPLAAACVGAIQGHPDTWVEPSVDGTTFPRTKVGAVPYAVEAGRASDASGTLATRIAALEARGGPSARQVVVGTPITFTASALGTAYAALSGGPTVTLTATATARYRVSGTVGSLGSNWLRIGVASGAPTIVWQPGGLAPTVTSSSVPTLVAREMYVSLSAGSTYTFAFEGHGGGTIESIDGNSTLVAEQLE